MKYLLARQIRSQQDVDSLLKDKPDHWIKTAIKEQLITVDELRGYIVLEDESCNEWEDENYVLAFTTVLLVDTAKLIRYRDSAKMNKLHSLPAACIHLDTEAEGTVWVPASEEIINF